MNLSLSSHLQGRIVALFFGFFIGGIAFTLLGALNWRDFRAGLVVCPLATHGDFKPRRSRHDAPCP